MADKPDLQVVALARGVERLTRRVDELSAAARRVGELEVLVQQLAADVAALVATVGAGAEDDGPPRVRSWLLAADSARARDDVADLTDWLGAVYLRYPGAVLPSCWLWHPAVVEELWWLRNAHATAYGSHGAWPAVADWHDRMRPGVVRRIRDALGGCELALHCAGGEAARPAPAVPLADAATLIADAWTTDHGTPLEPTEQQLTEAEQHDRALTRTNR